MLMLLTVESNYLICNRYPIKCMILYNFLELVTKYGIAIYSVGAAFGIFGGT